MKRILFLILGLTAALVLVLLALGLPVLTSIKLMLAGSLTNWYGISATLVKAIPLALAGTGIVVAWRAGMFSIGGEGQFLMGALSGAIGYQLLPNLPGPVLALLIFFLGVAGGSLYALLAGWLYVKRGIQVVISTILLNFIAIQLLSYAVTGPLKSGGVPMTKSLPTAAMLPKFDRQADLHWGFPIATVVVLALGAYLWLTYPGFLLRLVGSAPRVARSNRISVPQVQMRAMALSGALCGLAGAIEYVGLSGQLSGGFSQNWGFLAIPVALLGGLNPFGVLVSAPLFAALLSGSDNLSRYTTAGSTIVYIVQGIAVLGFVGIEAWGHRKRLAVVEP